MKSLVMNDFYTDENTLDELAQLDAIIAEVIMSNLFTK